MDKTKPKRVSKFLTKQEHDHNSRWSHANSILRLNRTIRNILPEPLNEHCGIANLENGDLSLFADTPEWCYKLRLHSSLIVNFLKKRDISIQKVHFLVVPPVSENTSRNLPKMQISARSGEILRQAGENASDPRLKAVYQRLSEAADHEPDS